MEAKSINVGGFLIKVTATEASVDNFILKFAQSKTVTNGAGRPDTEMAAVIAKLYKELGTCAQTATIEREATGAFVATVTLQIKNNLRHQFVLRFIPQRRKLGAETLILLLRFLHAFEDA